jgi:hypothetical protein
VHKPEVTGSPRCKSVHIDAPRRNSSTSSQVCSARRTSFTSTSNRRLVFNTIYEFAKQVYCFVFSEACVPVLILDTKHFVLSTCTISPSLYLGAGPDDGHTDSHIGNSSPKVSALVTLQTSRKFIVWSVNATSVPKSRHHYPSSRF